MLLFGFFTNLQNFAADQTFVQRYFTAKTEEAARRSVWIGAIAYIPIGAVLFFIGTSLFVFYETAGSLPPDTKPESVLPYFIISELPTGLAGRLFAAIMAAAMSTVDSSLNSSATLLLCDIWQRFFRVREVNVDGTVIQNDKADLRFLRISTLVLGVLGIVVAFILEQTDGMLKVWWTISGILSGGTLGLMLLARFTRASGSFGTVTAVVCGVAGMAVVSLAHVEHPVSWLKPVCESVRFLRNWMDPFMAIVVGTVTVFVVGGVLSRRTTGST